VLGSVWRGERPQLSGADAEHAYHSQDDLTEAGGWRHREGASLDDLQGAA